MGKVLYRKYRPSKLADVLGQEQVTNALENAIKQDKIGHAYLFTGPRGTGKTSVARIFAHLVNGFDYELEDAYLDIAEIDAASNNGVDNIRELREKAIVTPNEGKYKVYIIDEVHMLSKQAFNALLKTLEEPPKHVIFIMATTEIDKIPVTILSRTQVFNFKLSSLEIMQKHLRWIADQEKFKITDEALEIVVKRGGGSFRDTLSLLEQVITLSSGEITAEGLNKALGLPQDTLIEELYQGYSAQDGVKVQQVLREILSYGIKPETIASELIQKVVAEPNSVTIKLLQKLPEVSAPFAEAKLLLAVLEGIADAPKVAPVVKEDRAVVSEQKVAEKNEQKVETKEVKTEEAEAKKQPAKAQETSGFDWDRLLAQLKDEAPSVYVQLQKCAYDVTNGMLNIYPDNKLGKKLMERSDNCQKITNKLDGLGLKIHEPGEKLKSEDPTLSQISDIMGNIREMDGATPF